MRRVGARCGTIWPCLSPQSFRTSRRPFATPAIVLRFVVAHGGAPMRAQVELERATPSSSRRHPGVRAHALP